MDENHSCRVMEGGYWSIIAVCYGYASYFLRSYGFSAGEIGTVTALGSVLSAAAENWLGQLNDRREEWGWKRIFRMLLWISMGCLVLMMLVTSKAWIGILYTAFLVAANGMMPFTVIACFSYQNRGIRVDYGIARAYGSGIYAVFVYIIGILTERFGRIMVPVMGLVICLFNDWFISRMKEYPREELRRKEKRAGWRQVKRMYPAFFLMVAGMVLLFSFHNSTNTYLLQILERVGGSTGSLGTALAIAALMEIPVEVFIEKILKRISARNLLVLAGAGFVLKGLVYILARSVGMIYFSQVLEIVSYALYSGASPYYVNERIAPKYLSGGQAMMTSVSVLGALIGNLTGGWMLDAAGLGAMLWLCLGYAAAGTCVAFWSAQKEKRLSRS